MDRWMEKFQEYVSERGFRRSRPRELVAREFFRSSGHMGIEVLYRRVHRIDSKVGIATVYRTLGFLVESGLALRREFATGTTAYEKAPNVHHDHLLCTKCNRILEFTDLQIEALQGNVARKYGFSLEFHRMELYGRCKACRQVRSGSREAKA
ncbi:MAG: Fur family transcriptional regulator [Pseudomonadota bacterium]